MNIIKHRSLILSIILALLTAITACGVFFIGVNFNLKDTEETDVKVYAFSGGERNGF